MATVKKPAINYAVYEEVVKEGNIVEVYTLNSWFCKVKTSALGIGKILVSFAKKGAQGKGGIDVYVNVLDMLLLVKDIETGVLFKVIEAEKTAGKQYPEHYKYVTGAKGSKSVGLGASSNPKCAAVINGTQNVDGKMVVANVPVDARTLKRFAATFRIATKHYFDGLSDAYAEAASAANAYFYKPEEDAEYSEDAEGAVDDAVRAQPPEKGNDNAGVNTASAAVADVYLESTGKIITCSDGSLAFYALNAKKEQVNVIIPADLAKSVTASGACDKLCFTGQYSITEKKGKPVCLMTTVKLAK